MSDSPALANGARGKHRPVATRPVAAVESRSDPPTAGVIAATFPNLAELERLELGQVVGHAVLVTPDIARVWLHANTDNRAIRLAHLKTLAADMVEGRWRFSHQGIAFAKSGRLIDGQHRLQAIVESGVPVKLLVFVGIDDDMFGALDRGAKRTVRDELSLSAAWVDPCTLLARVMLGSSDRKNVAPAEAKAILTAFHTELTAVMETFGGVARGRTSAGTKASLMVRLSRCNAAQWNFLLGQWRAFARLDVASMDKTTASMLKRLDGVGTDQGATTQMERLAVGWIGWSQNRDLTRILIRDLAGILGEIRAEVRNALPEVREQSVVATSRKPVLSATA